MKSNVEPWRFSTAEDVRWLIEHPSPLFVCVVDKAAGELRFYQTLTRFAVWATLPPGLELAPGDGKMGTVEDLISVEALTSSLTINLSAPIIQVTGKDLFDNAVLTKCKAVLQAWIEIEQRNLGMFRLSDFRNAQ